MIYLILNLNIWKSLIYQQFCTKIFHRNLKIKIKKFPNKNKIFTYIVKINLQQIHISCANILKRRLKIFSSEKIWHVNHCMKRILFKKRILSFQNEKRRKGFVELVQFESTFPRISSFQSRIGEGRNECGQSFTSSSINRASFPFPHREKKFSMVPCFRTRT